MSTPTKPITPGRALITLINLSTSISCYIADFNDTHVYNPNWPPHARFHNGQTMSMGLTLGLLSNYFLWRPSHNGAIASSDLWSAMLVGSLYYITGLSAFFYPGTEGSDPDVLLRQNWDGKIAGVTAQWVVFGVHLALIWVGYGLEMLRLGSASGVQVKGKRV